MNEHRLVRFLQQRALHKILSTSRLSSARPAEAKRPHWGNVDRKKIYTRQNCTLLPMPCIDIPAELAMNPSEHAVVTVLRKRRRKIGLVSKIHNGHDVSLPRCSSTDPRFERSRISRLTISWTPFVDRRSITCSVAKFR